MKTNHTFLASRFNTTLKTAFLSIFLVFLFAEDLTAQCKPMIKIDGDATVIDPNDRFGLALPFWLKATQTLAVGSSVSKISVLEFNVVNGSTLEFSQVVIVTSTSPVTVPNGTVWKIESVAKENNSSTYQQATFASTGTYTWTVPACAEEICIDLWGAGGGGGGGGGGGYQSAFYGGGGAFGSQCFAVTPNTTYTITVGKGGKGGNWGNPNGINGTAGTDSKVIDPSSATIISAGGGAGGVRGASSTLGTGGAGGTSTASTNASGADGIIGGSNMGGAGGAGANGGAGGGSASGTGNSGISPSGGGSGNGNNSGTQTAGSGADGKVIISW